jgi:RNA polymerase sigma-70 factor, ECF subfamily
MIYYKYDSDFIPVQKAKAGKDNDLYLLWYKYEPYLHRFIRIMLPAKFDVSDIEEILGNVLVKFITNIPNFKGKSTFKTYIYTIAKNETYSFLRKHKNVPEFDDLSKIKDIPGAIVPSEDFQEREKVCRLLNRLKPADKVVLVLRFYGGLNNRQIATIIRKSEEAVKKMMQRAIAELGALYNRETKEKLYFKMKDVKQKKSGCTKAKAKKGVRIAKPKASN